MAMSKTAVFSIPKPTYLYGQADPATAATEFSGLVDDQESALVTAFAAKLNKPTTPGAEELVSIRADASVHTIATTSFLTPSGSGASLTGLTKTQVGLANVTNDAQITKALGTAKGSLIGFSAAATPLELAVGINDKVLTADSTTASGLAWKDAPAAGSAAWSAIAGKPEYSVGDGGVGETIAQAITAIGATEKVLVVPPGNYVGTGTIPNTMTVCFARGALLTSGTLTVNGELLAGEYNILNGGTLVFAGYCRNTYISPCWFGAKGIGSSTDKATNVAAINAAINSNTGTTPIPIILPPGRFYINSPIIPISSTILKGAGRLRGNAGSGHGTIIQAATSGWTGNSELITLGTDVIYPVVEDMLLFANGQVNYGIHFSGTGAVPAHIRRVCVEGAVIWGIHEGVNNRVFENDCIILATDTAAGGIFKSFDGSILNSEIVGTNKATSTGTGISLTGASITANNWIYGWGHGIDNKISYGIIQGNNISDNVYGIYGQGFAGSGTKIIGNEIFRNVSDGLYGDKLTNAVIKGNSFVGNTGYGVNLPRYNSQPNLLKDNYFSFNTAGDVNPDTGSPFAISGAGTYYPSSDGLASGDGYYTGLKVFFFNATMTGGAYTATIGPPAGTWQHGEQITLTFTDNGTGKTLAWNPIYVPINCILPTATEADANKILYLRATYNALSYGTHTTPTFDVAYVGLQ